jgi:hypothetical protein
VFTAWSAEAPNRVEAVSAVMRDSLFIGFIKMCLK